MKFQNKKMFGVLAGTMVLALAATGCGPKSGNGGDAAGGGSDSNMTVTFLPKNLGNPYFDTSDKGGAKAVKEFGGTYSQVGPQDASPEGQAQYIDTAAQQHTSAIVMSANDPKALCDSVKSAQDAGTKVVTFDSDTGPGCRDLFVNQATAEGIATVEVDMIAEQIGDAGEIAILSSTPNATNQNAWIAIMKKDLAANYPKLKLVDTVYGNDDSATSAEKAAALMQSHPNLKGIIAPTTVGVREAAKYISGSKYKGKVQVAGLGLPSEMRAYIKDGTVKTVGLWDPAMLGYVGVYAAASKASGMDVSTSVTAGDKSYTVDDKGVLVIGPPAEFTKDTVDNFTF